MKSETACYQRIEIKMKILCAEYNPEGRGTVVPIGDNALLRNNDDFYIPDFADRLSCSPQLVLRIGKLGKSVGERFAGRYFQEIGVGIRFYADRLEEELHSEGLPAGVGSAFDGCAAIGSLVDKDKCDGTDYAFRVNGKIVYEGSLQELPFSAEHLISFASGFYTLKIGDFLYCGNRFRYRELEPGDRLQICFQGKEWMDFKLK